MVSSRDPINLRHEDLHRNVSSNFLMLIPSDIRSSYKDMESMGVYTMGAFENGRQAIAVSGLASCGGLILSNNTNYLAIHLGGDARSVSLFKNIICDFCKSNSNFEIVAATGRSGSEDSVVMELDKKICEYTGKRTDQFNIYTNQSSIAIGSDGLVGIPTIATVKPAARRRGSSCCCIS